MLNNDSRFLSRNAWLRKSIVLTVLFFAIGVHAQENNLAKFIDDYARKNNFSGTVLVQNKGIVDYHHSYGLANHTFEMPNRDDTKYKIASITKMFTAVLVLQLQEQGRLDLNASIHAYLPNYSGEAGEKVTIHQLLNHTSGMANADKDASPDKGIVHYQTPLTTDAMISRFYSAPLVATPGTVFDYNNADYILLGKIVETLFSKALEDVISEKILIPLEMHSTGMVKQSVIQKNMADSYFYREDLKVLSNDLPVYMENWFASGAMYSTAADLLKFSNALYGNRLIKKASLDLMLKPGLDEYGYGLWIDRFKANGKTITAYRRPGQIMGTQTMLIHYRDIDLSIVILSNDSVASTDDFALAIGKKMLEEEN